VGRRLATRSLAWAARPNCLAFKAFGTFIAYVRRILWLIRAVESIGFYLLVFASIYSVGS
jgi:hypothetical protein